MLRVILSCAVLAYVAHAASVQTELQRALRSVEAALGDLPLNTTEWPQNPCASTRNFNYYIPFPNDTARYIQCDPWGTGIVKQCDEGTVWNTWSLRCDKIENVHNTTLILPHRVFNCSLTGHQCLNGGVCTESSLGGDRCICRPEYTGPVCESKVDINDLTHEILNGTFRIHQFYEQLKAQNITVDVAEYAKYKDMLDNATYQALMEYMSLYKGTQVRYDTLVNNLVENILEDIYPDAAYLSVFNSSTVSVVDLVQLIPNLMSYAKYSQERYQDVFAKYQEVLHRLTSYLNSTDNMHWESMRHEALEYSHLTAVFLNQTVSMLNVTNVSSSTPHEMIWNSHHAASNEQPTEEEVRERLRISFNKTLTATSRLYESLESFQNQVMELVQNGTTDVYSLTLEQSNLNGTAEVKKLLDQITCSSIKVWDSLVNYGFWFITTMLTTTADDLAHQQLAVLNLIKNSTVADATLATTISTPVV
jgi:hypothetical protein